MTVRVAGNYEGTLAAHEQRCLVLLEEEQSKPLPNNALIACLCDSVRIARESAQVVAGEAQSTPSEGLRRGDKVLVHATVEYAAGDWVYVRMAGQREGTVSAFVAGDVERTATPAQSGAAEREATTERDKAHAIVRMWLTLEDGNAQEQRDRLVEDITDAMLKAGDEAYIKGYDQGFSNGKAERAPVSGEQRPVPEGSLSEKFQEELEPLPGHDYKWDGGDVGPIHKHSQE